MPIVEEINVPAEANMGVAIEGFRSAWPGSSDEPTLQTFSPYGQQRRYIDVFNRGQSPFKFSAKANAGWIKLSSNKGKIDYQKRICVSIDWKKVPAGNAQGFITINGAGLNVTVLITTFNPVDPKKASLAGFVEADGYVSIEAEHYTNKIDAASSRWDKIDDYGRTLSSMTIFPVTAQSVTPPKDSPCLEYKMYLFNPGNLDVELIVAPTLNFVPGRGLRVAVSFDDQPPQIIDILPANFDARNGNANWEQSVRDACRKVKSKHSLSDAGEHTLKVWMVDPGVVLQKIIVNTGGLKPSYLGPPESFPGLVK